jgi:PAS domain-containing protein
MDWPAYLDVLAGEYLYQADSRPWMDAHPGKGRLIPVWRPEIQALCAAVFTTGMLPAPLEDPVFDSMDLGWYAKVWDPSDPPWLAVNPGSPCEAYFPAGRAYCDLWRQHAERVPRKSDQLSLRTLWLGAPRTGPVAHGLACGALLRVQNGMYWNAMACHGMGYPSSRRSLDRWWGITTHEQWQESQEELLRNQMSSPVWDFAFRVRRGLFHDFGGPVPTEHWREAAERVLRRQAATTITLSPDGVTRSEGTGDTELEHQVAGVKRLIGRVTRYEARFRADGLLAEGRCVTSVAAWDYGRAPNVARSALAARLCTLEEAETAVVRAGRVSAVEYKTWEDFSAAFILGRCLHFDDEEFGSWYQDALEAHRLLTTDPASPWRTVPFRPE